MKSLLYCSTVVQTAIVLVAFCGVTVLGLYVVRRLVPLERLKKNHDVAGFTFGVLGAFYGLLLAFVIVVAWQRYDNAFETVQSEALALTTLYRLSSGFEEPASNDLKRAVRAYIEELIDQDWPAMKNDTYQLNRNRLGALGLSEVVQNYQPATEHDTQIMQSALQQLDIISKTLDLRYLYYSESLPSVMWLIIWIGCAITIGFSFFFGLDAFHSQALMCSILSGMLGLTILAVYNLAHPFQGMAAVSDRPLRFAMEQVNGMDRMTAFGLAAEDVGGQSRTAHGLDGKVVKVGVLHSLTGTMAISEVPVKNATLLAIQEINNSGGVIGYRVVPLVEDGASEPKVFARKAQNLLGRDHVATIFGGWTSASRKAMLPAFERFHSLLWYPVQFEGNECDSSVMYSGAQPNQQILPALDWALAKGYRRIFLLGSDYIFPHTANLILRKHIVAGKGEVVGEQYAPLGGTDFGEIVTKIQLANPQIIFNTLNGDSNMSFFEQMHASGMPPSKLPVISFSIAEQEVQEIGVNLLQDSYAAWNYFESLDNPANVKFVAAYQKKFGRDAVVDDPMAHAYASIYEWAAAVRKANSVDPDKVRKAAVALEWQDICMGPTKIADNQSLIQTAYVGQVESNGQFRILWHSKEPIFPQPYDPLIFPNQVCMIK